MQGRVVLSNDARVANLPLLTCYQEYKTSLGIRVFPRVVVAEVVACGGGSWWWLERTERAGNKKPTSRWVNHHNMRLWLSSDSIGVLWADDVNPCAGT